MEENDAKKIKLIDSKGITKKNNRREISSFQSHRSGTLKLWNNDLDVLLDYLNNLNNHEGIIYYANKIFLDNDCNVLDKIFDRLRVENIEPKVRSFILKAENSLFEKVFLPFVSFLKYQANDDSTTCNTLYSLRNNVFKPHVLFVRGLFIEKFVLDRGEHAMYLLNFYREIGFITKKQYQKYLQN